MGSCGEPLWLPLEKKKKEKQTLQKEMGTLENKQPEMGSCDLLVWWFSWGKKRLAVAFEGALPKPRHGIRIGTEQTTPAHRATFVGWLKNGNQPGKRKKTMCGVPLF